MKKIISIILVLSMVLTFAACGKVEITMQDVFDAGQTEALLKDHQSVYIRDEMDGEFFGEKYLTKDYIFDYIYSEEYAWADFMTDTASYCYIDGEYVRYLPITPDGVNDDFVSYRAKYYASVLLSPDTVEETIDSVSKKDGRISVTSVLGQEMLENMAADGVTSGKFEYVLDAKTHEFLSMSGDYTFTDGTSYHMDTEVSYDTEAPEIAKTLLAYANQTENLRNITVVSNPGTEKEETKDIQLPKGLVIGMRFDEDLEYQFEVYTDAACTELYDPYADTESDLTIYIKWTA